jgi:hypothetical protein
MIGMQQSRTYPRRLLEKGSPLSESLSPRASRTWVIVSTFSDKVSLRTFRPSSSRTPNRLLSAGVQVWQVPKQLPNSTSEAAGGT